MFNETFFSKLQNRSAEKLIVDEEEDKGEVADDEADFNTDDSPERTLRTYSNDPFMSSPNESGFSILDTDQ